LRRRHFRMLFSQRQGPALPTSRRPLDVVIHMPGFRRRRPLIYGRDMFQPFQVFAKMIFREEFRLCFASFSRLTPPSCRHTGLPAVRPLCCSPEIQRFADVVLHVSSARARPFAIRAAAPCPPRSSSCHRQRDPGEEAMSPRPLRATSPMTQSARTARHIFVQERGSGFLCGNRLLPSADAVLPPRSEFRLSAA